MEISESLHSQENDKRITETVPVPQVPGEYPHISTSTEQMGNFFEEYANLLGFDGKAAKDYLQDNVDIVFTPISPSSRNLPQTKAEYLFDELTSRVFRKSCNYSVLPNKTCNFF